MTTNTMSEALEPRRSGGPALSSWLIVAIGLVALYLPTFIDMFRGPWASEKNAHGPIVMVVAFAFLYFRVRQLLSAPTFERQPAPAAGMVALALGCISYVLGRSQSVNLLEVGSLLLVLAGVVLVFFGARTLRSLWFAFFFMLFMIPLPPSVVDVVTLPLKIGVSWATEHLLYAAGYPISRSGVILNMGQYQLLVADACAGLNSLFTLEALGLLYMNLVRHPSVVRNVALATLIIPISFTANTIRIMFLALITYYFGDAAGQGFLHGFSGLVLFLSALLLIISVDRLLNWIVTRGNPDAERADTGPMLPPLKSGVWQPRLAVASKPGIIMLVVMLAAVGLSYVLAPKLHGVQAARTLEQTVPKAFGDWKEVPGMAQAGLSTNEEGKTLSDEIYDEVVMRTYVNSANQQVMLAVAYAREQRQEVKLHMPEICYPAQGYKVMKLQSTQVPVLADGGAVPGKHMVATGNNRTEAVTYWTRVGNAYPPGGFAMRLQIFRDGLQGRIDDGILVRASSLIHGESQTAEAYALQQRFLKEMVAATSAGGPALIASSQP